jgi:hypothetical protein
VRRDAHYYIFVGAMPMRTDGARPSDLENSMSQFLLDPLGFRLNGIPFWGFAGGDGDGKEGGGDDPDGDDGDDGDGDDGDAEKDPVKRLKGTLDKVIQERRAVRDEYRPYKAVLRELGIDSAEALKEALSKGSTGAGSKPEAVDMDKVRADARAEVQREANREVALSKVEAMAKGVFADPEDAVEHLRKNVDDLLGRDGKPDKGAIKRELDDLLATKPHWGIGKQSEVDFDGGARQPAGRATSMNDFIRQTSRAKRGQ